MKGNMNARTRSNVTAFAFIMCIVVIGGIVVYYQFMKRQQMESAVQVPTTEVEKLIARDMEMGYPETPAEVMKLWGRLNQCLYNTDLDDEQFTALVGQLRCMYSTELLAANPEKEQTERVKKELEQFRDKDGKIVNYSTDTGKSVRYKKVEGKECADTRISYFINYDKKYTKSFQDFLLIKEKGKWKIQGFREAETQDSAQKEKKS